MAGQNVKRVLNSRGKPALILLHSEWPKLHRDLAVLSTIGLKSLEKSALNHLASGPKSNPTYSKNHLKTNR